MPILVNDARWGKVQFPDDATNEEIVNYFIKLEAQEGPEFSTGEVLYRAAERGLTSTARGLEQNLFLNLLETSTTGKKVLLQKMHKTVPTNKNFGSCWSSVQSCVPCVNCWIYCRPYYLTTCIH
jgi:hypothetical protein